MITHAASYFFRGVKSKEDYQKSQHRKCFLVGLGGRHVLVAIWFKLRFGDLN